MDQPWFEVMADNYLNPGEIPHRALEKIRAHYPLTFHCLGMNLGSTDPLNDSYFKRLSELIDHYQPQWISDHLCWVGSNGIQSHDLLPLPYSAEAVKHAASRIQQACRETDNRVLASAALLERLAALPSGVTRRRLGELPMRGKERPLELDVLEAETGQGADGARSSRAEWKNKVKDKNGEQILAR